MKPIEEKNWSKELETETYTEWKSKEPYKYEINSKKKTYSIDTPPPYLNTPIHIGHAATYALMDMFARYNRMKGYNVLFPLGLDNNGLPIEMAAEKKFNIKVHQIPREDVLKKCKEVLEAAGSASIDSFMKLGIGFNSWKRGTGIGEIYETDSSDYRALTQATFIELWNKGLIYEDERLNNYCPGCKTTLADSEVERKEVPTYLNFVKFKIKETGKEAVIATTRPELLCTAAVAIYNPTDERYFDLNGKTLIVPVFNTEIKVMADEEADPNFGSGLVFMSASAGDQDAIRFLRKRNIKPIQAIGPDGLMLEIAGPIKGLYTKKARDKIIGLLKASGCIEKQNQFVHNVPICDRSGDEIEFISMKEYYLKQVEFKEELLKIAQNTRFIAESSKQMLIDWVQGISMDWPISRRRFYATEIPLWYCKKCNAAQIPPKGKYYQPWREQPPNSICKCGNNEFIGETRVLDTWFDSANSPLYVLQYGKDESFFKTNSPATLRPQGKDIVRTWLYYTLLKGYLLTGKSIFKDIWINYYIVDEKGKKMSKRVGNIIDPQEILNKYGAEPFRFWSAAEGDITQSDFRCSYERIEGAGKTVVKLWNVARFISQFPEAKEGKLTELDNWIIGECNRLVKLATQKYDSYDFHAPAIELRHFIWETFASHYLELAKNRAYNQEGKFSKEEQDAAIWTLHYVLKTILKLLAPIIPMITYKLYMNFTGKDIHFEQFPLCEESKSISFTTDEIVALNSAVWKIKKDSGKSLKNEISEAIIDPKFKTVEKDIVAAHSIRKLSYGETKITV